MHSHGNRFYRGMNPLLSSVNKRFIAAYSGPPSDLLFENLTESWFSKILGMYNIRKIMFNRSIYPAFGFREKEQSEHLEALFSRSMETWQKGPITLYTNNDYLPHIYVPDRIIIADDDTDTLNYFLSSKEYTLRTAIYFSDQKSSPTRLSRFSGSGSEFAPPVIEYRRISPVKYRVRVHGAEKKFHMVFSEKFDSDWKVFLSPSFNPQVNLKDVNRDCVLDGDLEHQVSSKELSDYIHRGWISVIGDIEEKKVRHRKWEETSNPHQNTKSCLIAFISKNYQGTIQNDNLPEGSAMETWLEKPFINEADHFKANTFANAWLIDPEKIKKTGQFRKHEDGSIDFELVIVYRPERRYLTGFYSSWALLVVGFGFLGMRALRRRTFLHTSPGRPSLEHTGP